MYAIVDIETTGGYASAHGITEIAVLIHDGEQVINRHEYLINPGKQIPIYIQALTGISNDMVENAPDFSEVAEELFTILNDKVFVAHNVNFDYSFLTHYLNRSGFKLNTKKLCTVRLARKIFSGLPSYSLGKLCSQLQIPIKNRHRAGGDVDATAILFSMLLQNDTDNHIQQALKKNSKEQLLPIHLPREQVVNLPNTPGVYYFVNNKGKVIYVGKAVNIQKRVLSHFSNNKPNKQKQAFLQNIYEVRYEECGTELMAFVFEALEIKRLWPEYNSSQKRFEGMFGLYLYEDQRGYYRLGIDKKMKYSNPIFTFQSIQEGFYKLQKLIAEFNLCPKLCSVQRNNELCVGKNEQTCFGACEALETPIEYNKRVTLAIKHLEYELDSFIILDQGRVENEKSCLLVDKGQFFGMGYFTDLSIVNNLELLKNTLTPHHGNDYIKNLIHQYAERNPDRKIVFS